MEIRAAKTSEFDEITDLLCTAFVEKCRPRYASQFYQDSSFQLHQSRVCVVDGKIVSHVRVSDRSIYMGQSVVKLGGVGMVATLPEYRRRGYASALMQDAVAYMESQGYDLSLLFTTIQPFYMNFGWASFPQTNFQLELRGRKTFEPSSWTTRPFDAQRDLTQISQIYNEHNKHRTGTVVRSEQHWRDGYSHQVGMLPSLVVERDGTIGAYANLGLPADSQDAEDMDAFLATYYPNLREVGYRREHPDSLHALSRAILEQAYEREVTRISGRLPRHHPLTILLSEESGSPLSFSIEERAMYRVISLSSLFQKLIPEFEARLQNADMTERSGSFRFLVGNQMCTLTVNRGTVRVTADERGPTDVSLDTYRFLKLLFGDATFAQLDELNRVKGLSLQSDEIATLSALFPKGEPMHWICDYF
ncbi:MAG: GNAT family N-acetyltransferase [Candidatus Poribacteria bacterium]|nr:GNAT family N-acetyltransferase [Candidatus Poribacteria bacterium]